jgi:predicted GIY-YIG superfamily endonuclease
MKYTVYVIKNELGKIYIGQTEDLSQRLKHHNGVLNSKKTSFTYKQKQGEWKIVYT